MKRLPIAMRMLRRNWAAGELRVLLLALFIAVASVTTVGFFADELLDLTDFLEGQVQGMLPHGFDQVAHVFRVGQVGGQAVMDGQAHCFSPGLGQQ